MSTQSHNRIVILVIVFILTVLISTRFEAHQSEPIQSVSYRGLSPGATLEQVIAVLGTPDSDEVDAESGVRLLGWREHGSLSVGFVDEQCIYLDGLDEIEVKTETTTMNLTKSMRPGTIREQLGNPDLELTVFRYSVLGVYNLRSSDQRLENQKIKLYSCVVPAPPSESVTGFRISQLSEPKARSSDYRHGRAK